MKEIDLTACCITDIALEAIAKHCQHLSRMELGGCQSITRAEVKCLVKSCQLLSYLDLRGCSPAISYMAPNLEAQYPALRVRWDQFDHQRSPVEHGAFWIF